MHKLNKAMDELKKINQEDLLKSLLEIKNFVRAQASLLTSDSLDSQNKSLSVVGLILVVLGSECKRTIEKHKLSKKILMDIIINSIEYIFSEVVEEN